MLASTHQYSPSVTRTVLVVGGGGREHALVTALMKSPQTPRVICAPGNPGIAAQAEVHPVDAADLDGLIALAGDQGVDLAIIGPEAPLAAGLADRLRAAGIPTVGPSAAASELEGSKAFSKEIMVAAGVPTAPSMTVTDVDVGLFAADDFGYPVAIKADGLAAGKGVVIARTKAEARTALEDCLVRERFGDAGSSVVVEAGLTGPEVSLLAVCDGTNVRRFPAARDYKPIGDANTGPNTGGMGSVSPVPDVPDDLADELVDLVHRPVIAELSRRGIPFVGVLYAGIMMTPDGPMVLEFNTRFGDPETQALLPRLDEDFLDLMTGTANGTLSSDPVCVTDEACVAVVLATAGYPAQAQLGDPLSGLTKAGSSGALVFHAGTALDASGRVVTAGGRVVAVAATGADTDSARMRAYAAATQIRFRGRQMRTDIGEGLAPRGNE